MESICIDTEYHDYEGHRSVTDTHIQVEGAGDACLYWPPTAELDWQLVVLSTVVSS